MSIAILPLLGIRCRQLFDRKSLFLGKAWWPGRQCCKARGNFIVQKILKLRKSQWNNQMQNAVVLIINCVFQFQKDRDDPNQHYHGEWDQMFNDIISNKSSGPECGSDMKEFYSQISRTIDLLNS